MLRRTWWGAASSSAAAGCVVTLGALYFHVCRALLATSEPVVFEGTCVTPGCVQWVMTGNARVTRLHQYLATLLHKCRLHLSPGTCMHQGLQCAAALAGCGEVQHVVMLYVVAQPYKWLGAVSKLLNTTEHH